MQAAGAPEGKSTAWRRRCAQRRRGEGGDSNRLMFGADQCAHRLPTACAQAPSTSQTALDGYDVETMEGDIEERELAGAERHCMFCGTDYEGGRLRRDGAREATV